MKENSISYPRMQAVGFLPKWQTESVPFNKFIISKSIYNINKRQGLFTLMLATWSLTGQLGLWPLSKHIDTLIKDH